MRLPKRKGPNGAHRWPSQERASDTANRTASRLLAWQVMIDGPRGPLRWSRYVDEASARTAVRQLLRYGFAAWVEGSR